MRLAPWLVGIGLIGGAGCLSIAGLDGDYSVGDVASGGGSASASVGTGGSTSSTGSATGGSGGGPLVEDCLDGVDNDGNGMIDCADPACQPDFECVPLPAVPNSWDGYFILDTETYPAANVQPCPDTNQPDVLFDGPGGAAQCGTCMCGSPTGATCSFPTMGLWTNTSNCNGGEDFTFAPGDGNCYPFPVNCGATCTNDQRLQLLTQSTISGNTTCPDSGGAPTLPPLWTNEHHVCALPASGGGGCQAGEACVSMGTSFGGACIQRDGAQTCPGEWPNLLTTYDDANDTRGCSTCSCTPGAVSCTGGSFIVSDDGACMGGTNADITISGASCDSAQNHLDESAASYRAVAGTVTGSCTAAGGQPTGSVTPTGEVTFCCL